MKILRFLVLFLVLTVGASGEDNREGRGRGWGGVRHRKPTNFRRKYTIISKPIYVGGHMFRNKETFQPLPVPQVEEKPHLEDDPWMVPVPQVVEQPDVPTIPTWMDEAHATASSSWDTENVEQTINQGDLQFDKADADEPNSFGISPRISISENGDISLGRSISFNGINSFHDEDVGVFDDHHDHDQFQIMAEDFDQMQKSFRTSRSVSKFPGRPEQLAATLSGMQQGNLEGLQVISTNQGAQSWNTGEVNASGGDIVLASSGDSNVAGEGEITTAGVVSVTSSGGSNGWKAGDSETFQGINVGNSAQAGDYLQATASGLEVSINNSGSSSASGTGSVTTSGSSSVVNSGSSSGGWRSSQSGPRGSGNGAQAGEQLGSGVNFANSGASSVTGSGSISSSGTTTVNSPGGNNGLGYQ